MNPNPDRPRYCDADWFNFSAHALIWLLVACAALVLMGFIAVLNDSTQRGEQRRVQQRATGSLLLADERGGVAAPLLTASDAPALP
ncbi:hypothetical protein [Hydrogenophaga sp.]|uniref:hypothetical protein n=1 Tax=Hydrogenophaga sp. TaxID=1904254 RepID=UPI0025B8308D|nr:hypothetical protein [Hydrogenophaga sp.]MBT9462748.1 hypothetical protein [Hydrogenophaga sp.]